MDNIVIYLGNDGDRIVLPPTKDSYDLIKGLFIHERGAKDARDTALELSQADSVTAKTNALHQDAGNDLGVKLVDGRIVVSSKDIAKVFNKAHKVVLRAIRNLDCTDEFTRNNFEPRQFYCEGNKRMYEEYMMTRDGFTFLVMGFSGKHAAKFKQAYIQAFNEMEKQLKRQQISLPF